MFVDREMIFEVLEVAYHAYRSKSQEKKNYLNDGSYFFLKRNARVALSNILLVMKYERSSTTIAHAACTIYVIIKIKVHPPPPLVLSTCMQPCTPIFVKYCYLIYELIGKYEKISTINEK